MCGLLVIVFLFAAIDLTSALVTIAASPKCVNVSDDDYFECDKEYDPPVSLILLAFLPRIMQIRLLSLI